MKKTLITRQLIEELENKIEKLYNSVLPKTEEPHIGVEIEFISPIDNMGIAQLLFDSKLEKICSLKDDGSVYESDSHPYGHELTVLMTETNYKRVMRKVCKVLREVKAKANKSCGLHVHLDMRSRNSEKAFKNLVFSQPVLYSMNPKSRAHNEYCLPMVFSDLNKGKRTSRQRGINACALSRFETLEVRLHAGSVDYVEITNWITLLVKIATANQVNSYIVTLEQFMQRFDIKHKYSKYVRNKVLKYNRGKLYTSKQLEDMNDEDDVASTTGRQWYW